MPIEGLPDIDDQDRTLYEAQRRVLNRWQFGDEDAEFGHPNRYLNWSAWDWLFLEVAIPEGWDRIFEKHNVTIDLDSPIDKPMVWRERNDYTIVDDSIYTTIIGVPLGMGLFNRFVILHEFLHLVTGERQHPPHFVSLFTEKLDEHVEPGVGIDLWKEYLRVSEEFEEHGFQGYTPLEF